MSAWKSPTASELIKNSSLCISTRGIHGLIEVDLLPLSLIDPATEGRGCGAFSSVRRYKNSHGGSYTWSACPMSDKGVSVWSERNPDEERLTCELSIGATCERARDGSHDFKLTIVTGSSYGELEFGV